MKKSARHQVRVVITSANLEGLIKDLQDMQKGECDAVKLDTADQFDPDVVIELEKE